MCVASIAVGRGDEPGAQGPHKRVGVPRSKNPALGEMPFQAAETAASQAGTAPNRTPRIDVAQLQPADRASGRRDEHIAAEAISREVRHDWQPEPNTSGALE